MMRKKEEDERREYEQFRATRKTMLEKILEEKNEREKILVDELDKLRKK
jgi:hypothetical protein